MAGKDPHHEVCLALFARLSEYIDGELDLVDYGEMERHLAHCPPCKACLATLERTIRLCRETGSRPVPAEVSRRLRSMIKGLC